MLKKNNEKLFQLDIDTLIYQIKDTQIEKQSKLSIGALNLTDYVFTYTNPAFQHVFLIF